MLQCCSVANERISQLGRQAHSAARDENAVIFTKAQQTEFEAFRTEVDNSTAETTLANR